MAGFFGFFDYSKPGPGVDKNAPKKKAFVVFFEIYFRKFWKLITANLLFVLVSLPLATIGLANAGLTYVTRNFAREKHAFVSSDFFDTIKKNWKQALAVGIINGIVTIVLVFDLYITIYLHVFTNTIVNMIYLAVSGVIAVVFVFMKYYIYMMMITFKLSIKQLYKNSFLFAFIGGVRNFLMALLFGAMYAIAALLIMYTSMVISIPVVFFIYVLLFPAFRSLLIQFTVFPLIKKHMIDPYYTEHPDEGKQERQALNLEEESDDDEERIFQDTLPVKEEPQSTNIPRQYSEEEMEKLRKKSKKYTVSDADDDDGTI